MFFNKFFLVLIFFILFSFKQVNALTIGEKFNDTISIAGINFYLPGKQFNLQNISKSNITEGFSFDEYYLTNIHEKELVSSVRILIGPFMSPQNRVTYINHDSVCDFKGRIFKKIKKSGYAFNCWGVATGLYNDNYKIAQNIFSNNYGSSISSLDQEIINFYRNQDIESELNLISQHTYFSFLNKGKHIAVEYYLNPKKISDLRYLSNNFLGTNRNKEIMNDADKKIFQDITSYINKLQFEFEKNIKVQKSLSLLSGIENNYKNINKDKKNDIVNKLTILEKMYKSGNLSKKEFNDAKKLLLKNN